MKVTNEFTALSVITGKTELRRITFTAAEQKTLRRAGEIADNARELWRASVDYDTDAEGMDTELAMIGISVANVLDPDGFEI